MKKFIFLLMMILIAAIFITSCAAGGSNKEGDSGEDTIFSEDLKNIVEKIYQGVEVELPTVENKEINEDNVEYYLGLSSMTGIKQGLASDAVLSTIPYYMCFLRVPDINNIEKIKSDIKNNIDLTKWICDRAEYVYINNCEDVIFLAVGKENIVQALNDSFKELASGNEGKLIYKNVDD